MAWIDASTLPPHDGAYLAAWQPIDKYMRPQYGRVVNNSQVDVALRGINQ